MSEVLTARDGAVLTITLNRPGRLQRVQPRAARSPARGARGGCRPGRSRGRDHGRRARLLRRARICASSPSCQGSLGDALEATYHPNIRLIRGLEKPVIAAVNGPAAGAGLSLASACDVRVASSAATFVPGFVGIGLVPDSGGTWFLHRLLGFARAFEWMSSNRRLGAEEALAWGLVSEVIPADDFEARVAEIAATWAALPTARGRDDQAAVRARAHGARSRSSSRSRRSCSRRRSDRRTSPKESRPSWRSGLRASPAPERHRPSAQGALMSEQLPASVEPEARRRTRSTSSSPTTSSGTGSRSSSGCFLVIPHLIWLAIWGIAVWFAVIAAWVVGIFTGRVPDGIHGFIARTCATDARLRLLLARGRSLPRLQRRARLSGRRRDRAAAQAEPAHDLLPAAPRDPGLIVLYVLGYVA